MNLCIKLHTRHKALLRLLARGRGCSPQAWLHLESEVLRTNKRIQPCLIHELDHFHSRFQVPRALTFNGGEFERSPQHQLRPGVPSSTKLETRAIPNNLDHIEGETVIFAGSSSVRNFADNADAVVFLSQIEVDGHFRFVIESSEKGC